MQITQESKTKGGNIHMIVEPGLKQWSSDLTGLIGGLTYQLMSGKTRVFIKIYDGSNTEKSQVF